MDTVYCVRVCRDYYNDMPEYNFFVCKNLYTAEQILKREYEKAKQDFLKSFPEGDEDAYFDEDELGKRSYTLWAQDYCSLSGGIEKQQIIDTYNPPARPIKNRLKELIKKK